MSHLTLYLSHNSVKSGKKCNLGKSFLKNLLEFFQVAQIQARLSLNEQADDEGRLFFQKNQSLHKMIVLLSYYSHCENI